MKIYLAAPWADKAKMFHIADLFDNAGHTITWRWWETDDIPEGDDKAEALKEQAKNDLKGVRDCDVLVLMNTKKSEGKAVEQGIAIALYKPILAIGKRGDGTSMNVFHYLKNYNWVDNVEQGLERLKEYAVNASKPNESVRS